MDTNKIIERLQEADKEFADACAKISKLLGPAKQTAKANYGEVCAPVPVTVEDLRYLHDRITYLREEISNLRQTHYEHLDGHLPKIVGAAALTKALKAIGMDGDYEVKKRTIYANDGKATSEDFIISRVI